MPLAPVSHDPNVPPPVRAPGPIRWSALRRRLAVPRYVVAGAVLAILGLAYLSVPPRVVHHTSRFDCANNLSQLAGLYCEDAAAGRPPRSGPALFLQWLTTGRIKPGQESMLLCPRDHDAASPGAPGMRSRYDTVDLDHPPADLCSFAVRDFEHFPLDPDAKDPQVLAACIGPGGTLRHENGTNVALTDGSVSFMDLKRLGLDPEDDILIGPESTSPLLRPLRFADPAAR